jgi:hypothetical protein
MQGYNLKIKGTFLFFVVFFVLTVPFPLQSFQNPVYFFEKYFIFFESHILSFLGFKIQFEGHFYSDSIDLLVHLVFILLFSILLTLLISKRIEKKNISEILLKISSYTLAFFLIKYGFDKLFKMQFYYPEPNILNTEFGKLDKDILFWSTMGKSYSYNVFMGLIEIIPGVLLFLKKTRKLGSFIAFGVLLNVLMINFSYGIEVKILSSFLLFLSVINLLYFRKEIFSFFIQNNLTNLKIQENLIQNKKNRNLLKFTIIFLIFFESTFLAFSSENFNDDLAKRPKFHGSYQIIEGEKLLAQLFNLKHEIKEFYVHRQGYFILKDSNNNFFDFKTITLNGNSYFLVSEKIQLNFNKKSSEKYKIDFVKYDDTISINSLKIQD